ncbi:RagB/SusD family nutrient uptake outer membrane protein [Parabacteroides sp. Marseille-P3160]|uniref:RagB/SusD family nutrient uptake outer membrane protein n=1 Tax=Parabacteroides sp. Marseille-P3160 TaxID=1917887 RepID=UPI0009BB2080|nr:RagB/SusD family nutrient uptake outer membrane protein [Parabacteroides sp. Marseille-P3160]
MKKNIYIILFIILGLTTFNSCSSSYLDEESYGATVAVFDTEEGSEALVHLLYTKVNNLYGGTFTFGYLSENGTDIWMRGQNSGGSNLADYKGLDAYDENVTWFWNHCYKAVWNTNLFLETIPNVHYEDENKKNRRRAEVLTIQSLFLWLITETWGDTYLPMTTDVSEGLAAKRSTRKEFYDKIIANLEEAVSIFPPDRSNEQGRIDQSVAKAFLSRMYLYNEDWDKAIATSTDVINNYNYELAPSWNNLWDETSRNKEFIWTTEFSSDESFGGGSSIWWQACAMFIDRFAGVKTELNWTGYGGCQMLPDKFYFSLFDKEADLRWKQGHQWVWLYNDPEDDTSAFPDMTTLYKDTALYLYIGTFTSEQRNYMKTRYTAFDLTDMFDEKGSPKDRFTFVGVTKFDDQTRPNAMSGLSSRDYPVIRLGEMYLIRAEANIRKASPDLNAAAADINTLRERVTATGYESRMKVEPSEMNLDFILDERGRELSAEFQRWFDLKRTGKLEERVKAHNPDAAPYIKEYHTVRPIPQTQFDGMPDPSTLGQNAGY